MQGERWPKWPEQRHLGVPSGHLRSGAGLSELGAAAIRASLRVTSVTQCRILSSKAGEGGQEGGVRIRY